LITILFATNLLFYITLHVGNFSRCVCQRWPANAFLIFNAVSKRI
jgi:hypothetical protein